MIAIVTSRAYHFEMHHRLSFGRALAAGTLALVACHLGAQKLSGGPGNMSGNVPLVVHNESTTEVCRVQLHNTASDELNSYLVCAPTAFEVNPVYSHDTCQGPCLEPGESRQFSVGRGRYNLSAHRNGAAGDGLVTTVNVDVNGPTEVSYGKRRAHPPAHDGLVVIDAEYVPPPVPGANDRATLPCTPNGYSRPEGSDCCSGMEQQASDGIFRCHEAN